MSLLCRVSVLIAGVLMSQPSHSSTTGQQLYERHCAICHAPPGIGYRALQRRLGDARAVLDQRTDLSVEFVSAIARKGIGLMPPFTRALLSDAELGEIFAYLRRSTGQGEKP